MIRFGSLLIIMLVSVVAVSAYDEEIFTLNDPRGDDFGGGSIVYPSGTDYDSGDLDLIYLKATASKKGTWFEARFANPVRSPGEMTSNVSSEPMKDLVDFDFYNLNIDLYIDTDGKPGSGSTQTLPGRKIMVSDKTAWERVVAVTPRPSVARSVMKTYLTREKKAYMKAHGIPLKGGSNKVGDEIEAVMEDSYYFPRRIKINGRKLRFFVPNDFLGGTAQAHWHYLVVITGCNPEQRMDFKLWRQGSTGLMMMPLGGGRPFESFGVSAGGDREQPPVVDVLLPTVEAQKQLLGDYDAINDRWAVVSGISPAAPDNVPAAERREKDVVLASSPAVVRPVLSKPAKVAPRQKKKTKLVVAGESKVLVDKENKKVEIHKADGTIETIDATDAKVVIMEKDDQDSEHGKHVFVTKEGDTLKEENVFVRKADGNVEVSDGKVTFVEKDKADNKMVWVKKADDAGVKVREKVTEVEGKRSVRERLKELKQLLDDELITEEEYKKLRAKILEDL